MCLGMENVHLLHNKSRVTFLNNGDFRPKTQNNSFPSHTEMMTTLAFKESYYYIFVRLYAFIFIS